ncbi:conserved hypothetical protein [metagenome]|uniref:AbiEi antitoxin N-terminal domain-containing protein n=1 Tax=metagenome TaxID=256318 RepID=A0A2P2BYJ9_9ZZZZ
MTQLDDLLRDQSGVISRRQVLALGESKASISRRLRHREWARVHPGVYVDHTGPLTWQQRAWAAVLFSWPAALSHESALRAGDGPGRRDHDESVLHVAVDRERHLLAPRGVRLHRVARLDGRVQWNLSPPRVRYDDAVLDLAADSATDLDALGVLSQACSSRRTTPQRLIESLTARPRIPRREWLAGLLEDIAEGSCSVLEHGYLVHVERAHDLPAGVRQRQDHSSRGHVFRDVVYEDYAVIVELDGRAFHDSSAARDRDLDRDLEAAVAGHQTLRIGYGQVFGGACVTAEHIGRILQRRGWAGSPTRCGGCGGSVHAC